MRSEHSTDLLKECEVWSSQCLITGSGSDSEHRTGVGAERGRWDSTRVAQLGSIGQEEEAEIWLLLHCKAAKPRGTIRAKAVRSAQAALQGLETSPRSPATLLGST